MVNKLTPNQIKLIRELLILNRGVTRKEILERLNINPTSLQFAINGLTGIINIEKSGQGNKNIMTLTKAGEQLVQVLNLL